MKTFSKLLVTAGIAAMTMTSAAFAQGDVIGFISGVSEGETVYIYRDNQYFVAQENSAIEAGDKIITTEGSSVQINGSVAGVAGAPTTCGVPLSGGMAGTVTAANICSSGTFSSGSFSSVGLSAPSAAGGGAVSGGLIGSLGTVPVIGGAAAVALGFAVSEDDDEIPVPVSPV